MASAHSAGEANQQNNHAILSCAVSGTKAINSGNLVCYTAPSSTYGGLSLVKYLNFLKVLIALGPKLPAILAALQALIDAIGAVKPVEGGLEIVQPTIEETEAEEQVACLVAGPAGAFDGTRLRGIFAFLKAHPELLKALAGLFGGLTGG
jgi:hypothetical protein